MSAGAGERGHLVGVDVARHVVGDVLGDLQGRVEDLDAVHRDHGLARAEGIHI